ncbi:MAG TPA: DUF2905 domain-containing protein [Armatimonadota bacterium]|jgi:hypothetical protein
MGKLLVGAGLMLCVLGLLLWAGERYAGRAGGLLPGDLHVQRGNWSFYFPIATSLALSVLLSLLLWVISKLRS